MKRALAVAAAVLALGITAVAQDEAESNHHKLMMSVKDTMGSLGKNLTAKDGKAAEADAKKLQTIFGQVHDFWTNKKIDDAVKTSKEASTAFGDVASLAAAGKFDEADAARKTAMGTCMGCHKAHREKTAEGTYKFKY